MRTTLKTVLAVAVCLCIGVAARSAVVCLKKFTFEEDHALDKWGMMVLSGKVEYRQMKTGDEHYVEALSEKAASALYYRIGFNLKEYPVLSWKWRALKFPDLVKAATNEEKDDYAARVYVIFPFLSFSSSQFLEYVWAENIPEGTFFDSPFGENVKMVVARSGIAPEGQWVTESRNVYQDYVKAFGKEPSRGVGAIAIMCDADGTKSTAGAVFTDIAIEGQGEIKEKGE